MMDKRFPYCGWVIMGGTDTNTERRKGGSMGMGEGRPPHSPIVISYTYADTDDLVWSIRTS